MARTKDPIVAARRDKVAMYLVKSVTNAGAIARELNETVDVIEKDIQYLKKEAAPWLDGLAFNGYIHDVRIGIEMFRDMERELQRLRQEYGPKYDDKGELTDKGNPILLLEIIRELRNTVNIRIETEGNGPTLQALKKIVKEKENRGQT